MLLLFLIQFFYLFGMLDDLRIQIENDFLCNVFGLITDAFDFTDNGEYVKGLPSLVYKFIKTFQCPMTGLVVDLIE